MADIPTSLLRHRVAVESLLGTGGSGQRVYGPAIEHPASVSEKPSVVIGPDGAEARASATIVVTLAAGRTVPLGSRVTLPSGRRSTVIAVALADDGGYGAWQHAALSVE